MVNAPELSPDSLMASIRRGNYYSSNGPLFNSIAIEDGNRLVAETSPVIYARLVGPRGINKYRVASEKEPMTATHFRMSENWPYARLEIEDSIGRKAWSNPLLIGNSK